MILKKVIVIIGIVMSLFLIINKKEELLIPNEAIRIRVIANSNRQNDIEIKEQLKDIINNNVEKILKGVKSIKEARIKINNNLENINRIVDKTLKELNYASDFNINYGLNYFPEKEFKGIKYNEGYYESLVITLGEGKGNNYWCVLYPPLCSIDENKKDYEYRLFIKDILNKYL